MSQERLSGISILAIESEQINKINTQKLIDIFAEQMARKVNL